ncbi:MAG: alpha/beta hydrolase [Methylocystis sp.]|jgi:pimeloyl-ACP methyl ester carboxylesterase|nr:alpha/beta hydrolase [Methylocystis sp.]MCA3582938.1 alpha/beta hydrolase [Methylocystis sp.]MCA3588357.1 alpha/beta hydrolase [Methylocystis sp.]MCA3590343.1 alpha/beta hydrolase [Methylocystis sp.]
MRRFLKFIGWTAGLALTAVAILLFSFRVAALWRENGEARALSPPGETVETPRGRVFVQSRGPVTGQPVLLVPGTAAWGGFWNDVMETLGRAGYRAIAVDLPPFGFSEHRPQADYGRVDQAERLKGIIDGMKLKAPIVVGHSFGAGSVVELAARHGAAIAGMVVVCGALALPEEDGIPAQANGWLEGLLHTQPVMRTITSAVMTNPLAIRPLLATMLHRKEAADTRQAGILAKPMARRGTTEAYAQWLPVLLLPERRAITASAAGIATITMPTAIIWGEKDSVTPLPQGNRLHALILGSSFTVLPDAGHIPHIEAPAAFLAILEPRLAAMRR